MRRLSHAIAVLAVLLPLACTSDKASPGDTVSTMDDTSSSSNPDDTGRNQPPSETVQIEFDESPGSDWRLAGFLAHVTDGEIQYKEQILSYEITGSEMEIGLWPPSTSLLGETWWSSQGAIFFLSAYADANGNEQQDNDEGILAVSTRVLLYEISEENPKGEWLLAETSEQRRSPDPTRLPLSEGISLASLRPRTPFTISGTVALSNASGISVRAGTLSYYEYLTEIPTAGRPIDEPIGDTFSFTLSQDLNAARVSSSPLTSFDIGIEVPMPYQDADGTNGFSAGDVQLGWTCLGSLHAALLYVPDLVDIAHALEAASLGIGPGWTGVEAVIDTLSWRILSATEAVSLVMSDSQCGTP